MNELGQGDGVMPPQWWKNTVVPKGSSFFMGVVSFWNIFVMKWNVWGVFESLELNLFPGAPSRSANFEQYRDSHII